MDAPNSPPPELPRPRRRWIWLIGLVALIPVSLVMIRSAAIHRARQIIAENRQIVNRRLKEFQGSTVRRPPYYDPALEGDAWEAHTATIALVMEDLTPEELELIEDPFEGDEAPDKAVLDSQRKALIEKLKPRLKDLRKGLSRASIRPMFDWSRGLEQESFTFPRQLSFFRVLALVAREWRLNGREQDSIELLSAGLAMAQDLSTNGAMIVHLVGEVNHDRLRHEIREILVNHGLSGPALRELLRILGSIELQRDGVAEIMDREFFCMKVSALNSMEKVVDTNWGVNPMSRFYYSNRVLLADTLRAFELLEEDVGRLKEEPNLRQAAEHGVWSRLVDSENPLVALLTPALGRFWTTWKQGQAKSDLVRCATALACYEAEKGRYPESLAQLVPEYLAVLPVDPFSMGAPLAYRSDGGTVTLYSRGEDGDDDGGKPAPEDNPGQTDCDLVWTVKRRQ